MPRNVSAYREELEHLLKRALAISSPGAVATIIVRLPGDHNLSVATTESGSLEELALLLADTKAGVI